MLDILALILLVIGGLNWGSIGIFQFDLVAWLFGGQSALAEPYRLYSGRRCRPLVHFFLLQRQWHAEQKGR